MRRIWEVVQIVAGDRTPVQTLPNAVCGGLSTRIMVQEHKNRWTFLLGETALCARTRHGGSGIVRNTSVDHDGMLYSSARGYIAGLQVPDLDTSVFLFRLLHFDDSLTVESTIGNVASPHSTTPNHLCMHERARPRRS